jgi:hypothetical protein
MSEVLATSPSKALKLILLFTLNESIASVFKNASHLITNRQHVNRTLCRNVAICDVPVILNYYFLSIDLSVVAKEKPQGALQLSRGFDLWSLFQ